MQALQTFRSFTAWNGTMLFMGQILTQDQIPWYYLPVWISITTPLLYLTLFMLGLGSSVHSILTRPIFRLGWEKRWRLALLAWLFGPLLAIIIGRSIIYDTWRHVFFIYPAIILLAVAGLLELRRWISRRWNANAARLTASLLVVVSSVWVAAHMIGKHPLEHLYFNRLAGPNLTAVQERYELDYWGLSYRPALEFIHQSDPRDSVKVKTSNRAGEFTWYILAPEAQAQIDFVESLDDADYYVTNLPNDPLAAGAGNVLYAVEVDGVQIARIYRLP
jgi:hypothetical protein